jgi:density-regulated protein
LNFQVHIGPIKKMVKSKSARKKKSKQEKSKQDGSNSDSEEIEDKIEVEKETETENVETEIKKKNTTQVVICPFCAIPLEYCEFKQDWSECREYMEKKHPEILKQINHSMELDKERKKETKTLKVKKTTKENEKTPITVSISRRTKKKTVTSIQGFEERGINTKKVVTLFKKVFACGCAEKKDGAQKLFIEVQGDVRDQLEDLLMKEFKIEAKEIVFLAEKKKKNEEGEEDEDDDEDEEEERKVKGKGKNKGRGGQ